MMKKWLSRLAAIFAAGMMACSAYAEQATATFSLRPEQGAQGDTVWYELVYDSGSHSTAGAGFYFNLEPGVSVAQVLPGDGVETAEISYNSTGQKLVLLYIDDEGGLSVPEKGAQLFRVALKNTFSEKLFPFTVEKTDVCATLENMDVIQVESKLLMQNLEGEQQDATPVQPPKEEIAHAESTVPQNTAAATLPDGQTSAPQPSEENSGSTAGKDEQHEQVPSVSTGTREDASVSQEEVVQAESQSAENSAQKTGNQAVLLGIAVPLICIVVGIAIVTMRKYFQK